MREQIKNAIESGHMPVNVENYIHNMQSSSSSSSSSSEEESKLESSRSSKQLTKKSRGSSYSKITSNKSEKKSEVDYSSPNQNLPTFNVDRSNSSRGSSTFRNKTMSEKSAKGLPKNIRLPSSNEQSSSESFDSEGIGIRSLRRGNKQILKCIDDEERHESSKRIFRCPTILSNVKCLYFYS